MTDNIEGLLEAKNQILDEKKRLQLKYNELQEQITAITSERDKALTELNRLTVLQPRERLIEELAVAGSADILMRELLHHFELVRLEDGNDVLQKEGETVAEFTAKGIKELYKNGTVKSLGHFLKGSGSTGGGATGSHYGVSYSSSTKTEPAKKAAFGLR